MFVQPYNVLSTLNSFPQLLVRFAWLMQPTDMLLVRLVHHMQHPVRVWLARLLVQSQNLLQVRCRRHPLCRRRKEVEDGRRKGPCVINSKTATSRKSTAVSMGSVAGQCDAPVTQDPRGETFGSHVGIRTGVRRSSKDGADERAPVFVEIAQNGRIGITVQK